MHAPFVKHRYEMQVVICEAENDVVWPLRAGCEKIVISKRMTRSCITNRNCYDIGARGNISAMARKREAATRNFDAEILLIARDFY